MQHFQEQDNRLVGKFEFTNFSQALDFVNHCGALFEQHNHHGDVNLHEYKYVSVSLTTHDAESMVTNKDRKMAQAVEEVYEGNSLREE